MTKTNQEIDAEINQILEAGGVATHCPCCNRFSVIIPKGRRPVRSQCMVCEAEIVLGGYGAGFIKDWYPKGSIA